VKRLKFLWLFQKADQLGISNKCSKASTYIVQSSKILVAEKAIWSNPNVIPGKVLPPATAEMMKQFYVSDEISRITPGIKDNVSVNL
jgi:hypothetical protein